MTPGPSRTAARVAATRYSPSRRAPRCASRSVGLYPTTCQSDADLARGAHRFVRTIDLPVRMLRRRSVSTKDRPDGEHRWQLRPLVCGAGDGEGDLVRGNRPPRRWLGNSADPGMRGCSRSRNQIGATCWAASNVPSRPPRTCAAAARHQTVPSASSFECLPESQSVSLDRCSEGLERGVGTDRAVCRLPGDQLATGRAVEPLAH